MVKRIVIDVGIVVLLAVLWFVGKHIYVDHANLHELVRVEAAKRAAMAAIPR